MKFIIIGLGNFGLSLAEKLTRLGNEVIGVDNSMAKVEAVKERITHSICMDATDEYTMGGLPFKDTDVVIVAIGEDKGANIMATAMVKKLHPNRIISRAIDPLHETILQAMDINTIVHPEEETSEKWAKKLSLKGIVDSFELSGKYSIVEVNAPESCIGRTIEEIGFRRNHNLVFITTIRKIIEKNILGKIKRVNEVQGVLNYEDKVQKGDILVLYGDNEAITNFIRDSVN